MARHKAGHDERGSATNDERRSSLSLAPSPDRVRLKSASGFNSKARKIKPAVSDLQRKILIIVSFSFQDLH